MKLPILFVCEDNELAVHSPGFKRHGYASVSEIVSRFSCNVLKEDSTDSEVIYELTCQAVRLMKTTQMPCFMHLRYYRYLEHVGVNEDFDAGYRKREEFEEWRKKDPVYLQREKIILKYSISEEEIRRVEREIDNQIANSLRLAKEAPFAEDNELYKGVFV